MKTKPSFNKVSYNKSHNIMRQCQFYQKKYNFQEQL